VVFGKSHKFIFIFSLMTFCLQALPTTVPTPSCHGDVLAPTARPATAATTDQWHQQQCDHGIMGNDVMMMVTQLVAVQHGKIHNMMGSSVPWRNG